MTQEKKPDTDATIDSVPPSASPPSSSPSGGAGTESPAEEAGDPVEEARAEAGRYKEQLLRTAADFDNFRKRTRRELVDAERRGRDDLLKELLPIFDNLERAVAHAESTSDVKALADGIGLVMRQFVDTLGKVGIERVKTTGTPFDPSVHEAIQHLETSDFPPGCIAAEVQAGYRDSERLVRPAMVVVAKAPAGDAAPPSTAGATTEPSGDDQ